MSDLLKVKIGGSSYLCKWGSDFLFLNNCDNLSTDGLLIKSKVGPNLSGQVKCVSLVDSYAFTGSKAIRVDDSSILNNPYSAGTISYEQMDYITLETMYSQMQVGIYGGWQHVDLGISAFDYDSNDKCARFCIYGNNRLGYTLYNNAYVFGQDSSNIYIKTNTRYTNKVHCAIVIDVNELYAYGFADGVLQCKVKLGTIIYNGSIYIKSASYFSTFNVEFLSIRNGDFSNNLQSFTIPTNKYYK